MEAEAQAAAEAAVAERLRIEEILRQIDEEEAAAAEAEAEPASRRFRRKLAGYSAEEIA